MSVETDMGTNSNQSSFYEVPKQRTDIITDEEIFNVADLKEAAARLDTSFSEFANTLMELNDLVNSRVNASCDECIFGAGYGAQLLTMWNNNVPTFSDFKTNFESWSRAVSVIATRNENTDTLVEAIYNNRTTGADLTTSSGKTVSEMREAIETSTGSSDASSSAATDIYFIQQGDKCTVHGQEVTFFVRDGSYNYYKDANGQIFIDADGGLRPLDVHESTWNKNYLKDPSVCYGAVTTTAAGASEMNLPTDVSSSNVPYDDYGMGEFVDSRAISTDSPITYTTNEGFRQDILSSDNRPQVVEFDHTLESDGWDIFTPDISTGADGKVTLVYDDRAGKYYTLDENGSYVRGGLGYTPEELAEYDIEKYQ